MEGVYGARVSGFWSFRILGLKLSAFSGQLSFGANDFHDLHNLHDFSGLLSSVFGLLSSVFSYPSSNTLRFGFFNL